MALKSLFASMRGRHLPAATAANREGAPAYAYGDRHALAQLAVTGTFGTVFYQTPEAQLAETVLLAERVDPAFLARTAVYARQKGQMKDMPAVLLAVLARTDPVLFRQVFGRVVDNGKMLRTFVQVMRSGQTGRKSLGTRPKAMVAGWLNGAPDYALLQAAIGNDPSLADVLRMVHPKPATAERGALFAWAVGKPCDVALLPPALRDWLAFKETGQGSVPDVPFQMLTQLPLNAEQWTEIALRGSWQMVRQNLNAFLRHGVFDRAEAVEAVAAKLRDPRLIAKARAFPYQLMVAARSVSAAMPQPIVAALNAAMEQAVANVPRVRGTVAVCPDVSGSMQSPVTGWRRGATSTVRFVDVAALVAAAVLRQNPQAEVLPFDTRVRSARLRPREGVARNAERLALNGGGTACSAPLEHLERRGQAPDLVVLVSDNQSWVDARPGTWRGGTAVLRAWERLRQRNPKARLVCIDIAPYGTTQAVERADIVNVGGFSDAVFTMLADVAAGRTGPDYWVAQIEATAL
ncbi:MAG: RNA-binding protein [Pseudomonadota bacterium]